MYISLDVAIKNLGIFITKDNGYPLFMRHSSVFPYTIENLIISMDEIVNTAKSLNEDNEDVNVIVERQLPKNYKACKMMYHIECYFYMQRNIKINNFSFVDPKSKGITKNNLSYRQRKNESILNALLFLNSFSEKKFYKELKNLKKKDDVADAICQLYYYINIPVPTCPKSETIFIGKKAIHNFYCF